MVLTDDCDQDSDCSNGGKCIDTHAVSSPRKQCFCAKGFFGDKCSKVLLSDDYINLPIAYVMRKYNTNDRYRGS